MLISSSFWKLNDYLIYVAALTRACWMDHGATFGAKNQLRIITANGYPTNRSCRSLQVKLQ
jgi:hypothetical protein